MIFLKNNSDITNVSRGIITHGCNTKGVMGSGVALAIRNKWPEVYECYKRNSILGDELLGSCHMVRVSEELWIANCYTQTNYGRTPGVKYASLEAIKQSLNFVFMHAAVSDLVVHAPRIGAGLGGLDWESEVLPVFEELNNVYDGTTVVIHTI